MRKWLAAGALALSLGWIAPPASAQTTTVPGQDVGLAVGAPLPEGVYLLNTFIYRRTDQRFSPDTAVEIPVLVWSTPWKIFDARLELLFSQDTVFAFGRNPAPVPNRDISINVGTFVGAVAAWDLGGGVGVSYLFATYLNDANGGRGSLIGAGGGTPVLPQLSSNTYRQDFSFSYTGDGTWNISAQLVHNFYDSPGRFGGAVGAALGRIPLSDALSLYLTATKKFDLFHQGKANFEFGPIAYGTVNLNPNLLQPSLSPAGLSTNPVGRGGRFAVGGLIGYDFGPFSAQIYAARDVVTTNTYTDNLGRTRSNYSTDGFLRFIVPLYTPPKAEAAAVPLVRKY